MPKIVSVFTIRVVYKSGYTHDFECYSFTTNGSRYSWDCADVNNKPLQLGADDVAAIWQVGSRKTIKWG